MGSFCGVGGKTTRCLKLVKIMLETCNLVCYYTHNVFSENIPFSVKTLLISLMAIFFCKKLALFFGKNSTFKVLFHSVKISARAENSARF